MKPQPLVLASGNAGKARELEQLLPAGFSVRPQSDWNVKPVAETGLTYVENALLKARHAATVSGLPAIADDSGLEVDFLSGAPGLYSARFAGLEATDAANVAQLLEALAMTPPSGRRARFRCVLVCLRTPTDAAPILAQGLWEGQILEQARGAGGFGYDPVFLPTGSSHSSAEMDATTKNRLSHRGQAMARLIQELRN